MPNTNIKSPEEIKKHKDDLCEKHAFKVPYNGTNEFYNQTKLNSFNEGFDAAVEFLSTTRFPVQPGTKVYIERSAANYGLPKEDGIYFCLPERESFYFDGNDFWTDTADKYTPIKIYPTHWLEPQTMPHSNVIDKIKAMIKNDYVASIADGIIDKIEALNNLPVE